MSIENNPSRPTSTEQIPHSGIHHDERPVREFDNTTLADAVEQGIVAPPPDLPPTDLRPSPIEPAPKKRRGLLIGAAATTAGILVAGGVALGLNLNKGGNENNTPTSDPKATSETTPSKTEQPSASSSPKAEQTTGPSEAEMKAELARLDTLAKTNPEAFMQESLANRLLWRDQYTKQVEGWVNHYAIHAEHYVVNENPSIKDDGQTIMNDHLIGDLGGARGFITEPSDANGNKWTQDYNQGESFVSAYWVLDQKNPNAQANIARINKGIEQAKGFNADFAPTDDDVIVRSTTDGQAVEIEGQSCPTKVIEAEVTSQVANIDSLATITMALFKYKDAAGNEKSQWVEYKVFNHG